MKKVKDIPKFYIVSNGNDGKEILLHLRSFGGVNKFFGADYTKSFRWRPIDFSSGDCCYIDDTGYICLSFYKPEGYKEIKLNKQFSDSPNK